MVPKKNQYWLYLNHLVFLEESAVGFIFRAFFCPDGGLKFFLIFITI
jgi:hypothetical protein